MAKRRATVTPIKSPLERRQARAFTPFKAPSKPPPGTYDPALDAQQRAGKRGLADLVADVGPVGRLTERATSDYGLELGEIDRQAGYARGDLERGLSRAVADHGSATAMLGRRYTMLGESQADQQAAAGVDRGGTALAAMMKRTENQAVEQAPLDASLQRFKEDTFVSGSRLLENVEAQKGALGLAYRRGGEDNALTLERAGRENVEFGLDLGEQRFYQAEQSGYAPPSAPASEHSKGGVTYRVHGQGQGRKYTLPNGRQVSRDEWVNLWRFRRNQQKRGLPGTGGPWARLGVGELSG